MHAHSTCLSFANDYHTNCDSRNVQYNGVPRRQPSSSFPDPLQGRTRPHRTFPYTSNHPSVVFQSFPDPVRSPDCHPGPACLPCASPSPPRGIISYPVPLLQLERQVHLRQVLEPVATQRLDLRLGFRLEHDLNFFDPLGVLLDEVLPHVGARGNISEGKARAGMSTAGYQQGDTGKRGVRALVSWHHHTVFC